MKRKKRKTLIPVAQNIYDGFMTYVGMINYLKQNKITAYSVDQDIKTVKIEGNTIVVPPNLEHIITELIKESTRE